jgi:hypothetical protein
MIKSDQPRLAGLVPDVSQLPGMRLPKRKRKARTCLKSLLSSPVGLLTGLLCPDPDIKTFSLPVARIRREIRFRISAAFFSALVSGSGEGNREKVLEVKRVRVRKGLGRTSRVSMGVDV